MIKSVSLRNSVLFIRVMLQGRVRSWYGVIVCWGRYGRYRKKEHVIEMYLHQFWTIYKQIIRKQ